MNWFEIAATLTEALISCLFIFALLAPKTKNKPAGVMIFLLAFTVVSAVTVLMNNIDENDNYSSFVYILIEIIIAELFLEGKHSKKIFVVFLEDLLVSVSGMLTIIIMPIIYETKIENVLDYEKTDVRIISLAAAKGLQLVLCLIFIYLIQKAEKRFKPIKWEMSLILVAGSVACTNLLYNIVYVEDESIREKYVAFEIIAILAMNVIVFFIVHFLFEKENDKKILQDFIQYTKDEVEKYTLLEEKEEEIRALRHEIRNEYIPLYQMLTEGHVKEAENKLKTLIGESEDTIKQTVYYDCGNTSINAVMNYYAKKCCESEIEYDCKTEKIDFGCLDESVFCSVFLNVEKNAYEAAVKSRKKEIITELKNNGQYVIMIVKNSFKDSEAVYIKEGETSKQDKTVHGFGLRTVRKKVKEQNGIYLKRIENGMFVTEIWLPVCDKQS